MSCSKSSHRDCGTHERCIPEHWVDKLFFKLAARYQHRWTSQFPAGNSPEALQIVAGIRREWQMELAKADPDTLAAGIEMAINHHPDWPPMAMQIVECCHSVARDRRMTRALKNLQIANKAKRKTVLAELEKMRRILQGRRLTLWQDVHGMRRYC